MRLIDYAVARSGDKGEHANVAVIARDPKYFEKILSALTEERVKTHFASLHPTKVTRFVLPNLFALNFILYGVLKGGGSLNLAIDAQGKTLGQRLLEVEMP